ncbi:MAG: hypothetical protein C4516_10420 [Oxalobacter sp.]|nr:MAG: hypothetical protein C4516_10420 [Oxalobacter sp.]
METQGKRPFTNLFEPLIPATFAILIACENLRGVGVKKFASFLLALVMMVMFTTSAARAEIASSIQLQQDQIVSDLKSGFLKPSDAQVLLQHLDRIKSELKRAKSDGQINHYETEKLNRMLYENAIAHQRSRKQRK